MAQTLIQNRRWHLHSRGMKLATKPEAFKLWFCVRFVRICLCGFNFWGVETRETMATPEAVHGRAYVKTTHRAERRFRRKCFSHSLWQPAAASKNSFKQSRLVVHASFVE